MVQRNLKHSSTNNKNAKITQLIYPWQRNTRQAADRETCSSVSRSNTYTGSFFNINCHIDILTQLHKFVTKAEVIAFISTEISSVVFTRR